MAAVEYLRIHTVKVAHQPRQARTARVQHEGIVIVHQAIGQRLHIKTLHALLKHAEQGSADAVIPHFHHNFFAPGHASILILNQGLCVPAALGTCPKVWAPAQCW